MVPVDDLVTITVSDENTLSQDTEISGETDLGRFEAMSHPSIESFEGTLYIILHKQPALISQADFAFSLNGAESLETVEEIRLISGDIYSGEGVERGYSLVNLQDAAEQKVIWQR